MLRHMLLLLTMLLGGIFPPKSIESRMEAAGNRRFLERAASALTAQFMDFRKKEIINVKNGLKIGYVDDILFDTEAAEIRSIVVYGRLKLFGLLGREEDLLIPWEDIEIVGEDTILVKNDGVSAPRKAGRGSYFGKLFD